MRRLIGLTIVFGLLLFPAFVRADPIKVGDLVKVDYGSAHSGSGGEFSIRGAYPNPTYYFETFCVEKDEYFNPGYKYTVISISDKALQGGINTNAGDPLDDITAWLYWMFRTNPLGLNNGGYLNNAASAEAMQNAIWYIEQEITSINGLALAWFNQASTAVSGSNGWKNNGKVAVINLVDLSKSITDPNYYKQDQLTLVPEAGTLLLLGTGLLSVVMFRRRKRQ